MPTGVTKQERLIYRNKISDIATQFFYFSGICEKDGVRVGFGNCTGKVLPANPL